MQSTSSHRIKCMEVFQKLKNGACCGAFPEGVSHNHTDLLPLRAGVSIMAPEAMLSIQHATTILGGATNQRATDGWGVEHRVIWLEPAAGDQPRGHGGRNEQLSESPTDDTELMSTERPLGPKLKRAYGYAADCSTGCHARLTLAPNIDDAIQLDQRP